VAERGTDLGTLGGIYSAAAGINDQGQVVGYSLLANSTSHAFLWQDGVMAAWRKIKPARATAGENPVQTRD
jgi:probable HAF family extracellular repeat protein